jgi:hypothetical protein
LLQSGVSLDVGIRNEVGSCDALDKEEELLRAVDVNLLMEWTWLASAFEDLDVDIGIELVIECLELELQLGSIGYRESLVCGDSTVVAWYRGCSWAMLHVQQSD